MPGAPHHWDGEVVLGTAFGEDVELPNGRGFGQDGVGGAVPAESSTWGGIEGKYDREKKQYPARSKKERGSRFL